MPQHILNLIESLYRLELSLERKGMTGQAETVHQAIEVIRAR